MKKILLVFFAALMAIGFTAFTPKKVDGSWYRNTANGPLLHTIVEPCAGDDELCFKEVPEEDEVRQLFDAQGNAYREP